MSSIIFEYKYWLILYSLYKLFITITKKTDDDQDVDKPTYKNYNDLYYVQTKPNDCETDFIHDSDDNIYTDEPITNIIHTKEELSPKINNAYDDENNDYVSNETESDIIETVLSKLYNINDKHTKEQENSNETIPEIDTHQNMENIFTKDTLIEGENMYIDGTSADSDNSKKLYTPKTNFNNIQLHEKKTDSKNYLVNINDIMLIKPIVYTICFKKNAVIDVAIMGGGGASGITFRYCNFIFFGSGGRAGKYDAKKINVCKNDIWMIHIGKGGTHKDKHGGKTVIKTQCKCNKIYKYKPCICGIPDSNICKCDSSTEDCKCNSSNSSDRECKCNNSNRVCKCDSPTEDCKCNSSNRVCKCNSSTEDCKCNSSNSSTGECKCDSSNSSTGECKCDSSTNSCNTPCYCNNTLLSVNGGRCGCPHLLNMSNIKQDINETIHSINTYNHETDLFASLKHITRCNTPDENVCDDHCNSCGSVCAPSVIGHPGCGESNIHTGIGGSCGDINNPYGYDGSYGSGGGASIIPYDINNSDNCSNRITGGHGGDGYCKITFLNIKPSEINEYITIN
jgi:hypothetical protein